jgi:murein tripeptide amidase MpaA
MKRAFQIRSVSLCVFGAVVVPNSSHAAPALMQQNAQDSCDVHIWQRGIYVSESHAPLAAYGLVGAVMQSEYNKKYPPATVEGQMEHEFNINALPVVMNSIQWQNYTGSQKNNIVFEKGEISEQDFKTIKLNNTRNSQSQSDCYIEIYIGKQQFSGGSLKSHLFIDFYARTFYNGEYKAKGASLWDQTRKLVVTNEESLMAARENLRNAFVNTFNKFLSNKLPKK